MTGQYIDLAMNTAFVVRFGQTIIIGTGFIIWLLLLVGYRHKMQDRKYKP